MQRRAKSLYSYDSTAKNSQGSRRDCARLLSGSPGQRHFSGQGNGSHHGAMSGSEPGNKEADVSRGQWTRTLTLEDERLEVDAPALLGVVGDTHATSLPRQELEPVIGFFRRAQPDLILHTGDAGSETLLVNLASVARVAAVRGNADPPELIDALPDRVWITIGKRTVLLLHGHHDKTALKTARAAAALGIDLIVFGHSHRPLIEKVGETILFNPGSPTERRWNPHFGIGLIRVSDDAIEPELVLFDDIRQLETLKP
jgi:uncharacterized protein